jgi:hypothetical protein
LSGTDPGPYEATEPLDAEPVKGYEVLEKLAALPVSTWRYKTEPPEIRHLGPMAQDFMGAFGLGDSDKHINFVDANGVLLVAVQALYRQLVALEGQVAELKSRLGDSSS